VGPRAGLDTEVRGKILCPRRGSNANKYKNIILPDVLYGCETSFLKLTEAQRLRMFKNWVLRIILDVKGMK
jgi:hypothetical protein